VVEALAPSSTGIGTHEKQCFGHHVACHSLLTEMWRVQLLRACAPILILISLPQPETVVGIFVAEGAAIYAGTRCSPGHGDSGGWIADRFLGHYRAVLVVHHYYLRPLSLVQCLR